MHLFKIRRLTDDRFVTVGASRIFGRDFLGRYAPARVLPTQRNVDNVIDGPVVANLLVVVDARPNFRLHPSQYWITAEQVRLCSRFPVSVRHVQYEGHDRLQVVEAFPRLDVLSMLRQFGDLRQPSDQRSDNLTVFSVYMGTSIPVTHQTAS